VNQNSIDSSIIDHQHPPDNMTSDLILYRKSGACSFAPHAILVELGIEHGSVELEFVKGKMAGVNSSLSNAEYKKIHPSGYVPALLVDGTIITELPAVCSFIADWVPERKLMGSTPVERAKVLEWMCWLSGSLHNNGYGALWRANVRFTTSSDPIVVESIKAKGLENVMDCYSRAESKIGDRFVVGSSLTIVDFAMYVFSRWGVQLPQIGYDRMLKEFPKLCKMMAAFEARESVLKTLQKEGIDPVFKDKSAM
jgi:glutathione S-transferase